MRGFCLVIKEAREEREAPGKARSGDPCASCGDAVEHALLTADGAVVCFSCAYTFYVAQMHLRGAAVWSTPSWLVESVFSDDAYTNRLREMGPTAKTAQLKEVVELVSRKKNHAATLEPFHFKFAVGSTVSCCHCGIEGVVEQGREAMNFSVAPDLIGAALDTVARFGAGRKPEATFVSLVRHVPRRPKSDFRGCGM